MESGYCPSRQKESEEDDIATGQIKETNSIIKVLNSSYSWLKCPTYKRNREGKTESKSHIIFW